MLRSAYWSQNQCSYQAAEDVMWDTYNVKINDDTLRHETNHIVRIVFEEDCRRTDELFRKLDSGHLDFRYHKKGILYIEADGAALNTRYRDDEGSTWCENKLGEKYLPTAGPLPALQAVISQQSARDNSGVMQYTSQHDILLSCSKWYSGGKKEVTDMVDSRCGLHCTGCGYKKTCNCGGCIETEGRPFHGECPVAKCCQEKGFLHCGQCPDIPCDMLTDYSCDPEHGDTPHGARIEQCRAWHSADNA